jgi:peptide deformylase
MAVRPILLFGDPRLEADNAPVESFDEELARLADDMFETAYAAPGLGLAAPQVGVNLRIAVVDLSVGKNPDERLVIANPRITSTEGRCSLEEGCLSFPGLFTRLDYQDIEGNACELHAEGVLAQALCHEVDHLDGVLLVHHLRGMKRKMFLRRVRKMRELGVWQATA